MDGQVRHQPLGRGLGLDLRLVSNAGLLRLSHLRDEQKHTVGGSRGGGEDGTAGPLKLEGMLLHGIKNTNAR